VSGESESASVSVFVSLSASWNAILNARRDAERGVSCGATQVERDLMIWNNKRYVSRPLYVKSKEDSLIQRHRRWYSQFYSEHSPTIKLWPATDTLDW